MRKLNKAQDAIDELLDLVGDCDFMSTFELHLEIMRRWFEGTTEFYHLLLPSRRLMD